MTTPPIIDAEFKALMPPLSAEEFAQLEQNMLAGKKCNDAILLWDGIIVDGMNRYAICAEHEIEFSVVDMSFDSREDVKIWIIENQLGRRNLHAAARIELALCKEKLLREKAKANLKCGGSPSTKWPKLRPEDTIDVRTALAKEADVGEGTLGRYVKIKNSDDPELLEKVQSGEIKIGTAYKTLPDVIEKQLKQAEKTYAYIKERLPFADEAFNAKINDELTKLYEMLEKLLEDDENA